MKLHHVSLLVALHVLSSNAQFGAMPYPQPMPIGMQSLPGMPSIPGMPSLSGIPGMPGMPMHMPMVGAPGMPSIVMPYHSRKADNFRRKSIKRTKPKKKRRRYKHSDSKSDSDSQSTSSSAETRRAGEKYKRRRQVLTPVISYVTKDGYVVYQKKIKKEQAKDWLELGKNPASDEDEEDDDDPPKEQARKTRLAKRKRHAD